MRGPGWILVLAGLSACASGGTASTSGNGASASPSTASAQTGSRLIATLVPTNSSGNRIVGTIRLVPSSATEYTADIDVRGGGILNKYGWEVRAGRCGESGQALGNPLAYPVIETRGDGMAKVRRPLKLSIPEESTHHIVVFSNNTTRDLVVSCGVLSAQQ